MAAWRYKISLHALRVLKKYFSIFQHEKRNFVPRSGHVMFNLLHVYKYQIDEIPGELYMCCERCDLLCNHSNGDLFTCEDNMLFSHVSEDIMLSHESSPGISLVFI